MLQFTIASQKNVDLLFAWANDPITRQQSLNNHEITYDEHVRWLNDKCASDVSKIWIAEDENVPVGQVRVDANEDGYGIVSISVAPECRGKGYGVEMLRIVTAMCDRGELPMSVCYLKALVKKTNIPSQKIFFRAGFKQYDENEEIYVYWYPQQP